MEIDRRKWRLELFFLLNDFIYFILTGNRILYSWWLQNLRDNIYITILHTFHQYQNLVIGFQENIFLYLSFDSTSLSLISWSSCSKSRLMLFVRLLSSSKHFWKSFLASSVFHAPTFPLALRYNALTLSKSRKVMFSVLN